MRRKGLSELIAVVILIAIVIISSSIYISQFTTLYKSEVKTFLDVSKEVKRRQMEMLSLLFYQVETRQDNTTAINLYVYNYGFKEISIINIYIDTEQVNFNIFNLDGKLCTSMEVGDIYRIEIVINKVIKDDLKVIIITKSNRVISYTIGL